MSLPPDAREAAAIEEPDDEPPKPLLGATFWAMIVLMLFCVLGGLIVANYGPRIFGGRLAPNVSGKPAPARPSAPAAPR